MSQEVFRGTPVAHARLPAQVQRLHDLQVVAAHESRSAADDSVQVGVEVGDPTGGSGRACVGGVAVAISGAGRAEGVEVVVVPFVDAGRWVAERAIETLFANRAC